MCLQSYLLVVKKKNKQYYPIYGQEDIEKELAKVSLPEVKAVGALGQIYVLTFLIVN